MLLLRTCVCSLLMAAAVSAQPGRGGVPIGPGRGGAQQGPPPKTDCEASGIVVNAVTGEPIPRAMVSANPGGAATDTKGEWSVTNQTCGRWVPTASHPGFLNGNGNNTTRPSELVSGSPVRGIKIALIPESSISGHVQDTNGDPIEEAQIFAVRVGVQNGYRTMMMTQAGNTDQQGNFAIGRLPPGRYVVCAQSGRQTFPVGGGDSLIYTEDCYPGPIAQGPSVAMPVEGGREVRVSLTLRAGAGLHVRGTVSGLPGTPGGNVRLQRIQNDNPGRGPMNFQFGPTAMRGGQIGRDGTFDIANVAPGSYMAIAQLPGGRGGPPGSAQARVDVGNASVEGVHLTIEQPGSVTGRIRYDLSDPTLLSRPASNNPGANQPGANQGPNQNPVNLNLNPLNPGMGGPGPGQVKWDEDRITFNWPQVPSNEYRLMGNARLGMYIRSATLRGQDVMNQPFHVDGATGPIEVVISDDTGTFNATVTDRDDHATTATIILKPASGQIITLRSGDDGTATRDGVPSGDYQAWAFDDISNVPWADEEWMRQHAGASTRVTIAKTSAGTIALKRITAPND